MGVGEGDASPCISMPLPLAVQQPPFQQVLVEPPRPRAHFFFFSLLRPLSRWWGRQTLWSYQFFMLNTIVSSYLSLVEPDLMCGKGHTLKLSPLIPSFQTCPITKPRTHSVTAFSSVLSASWPTGEAERRWRPSLRVANWKQAALVVVRIFRTWASWDGLEDHWAWDIYPVCIRRVHRTTCL